MAHMSDIQKIHSALIVIMKEIDRICKDNHICYTLTGGSMIGAVRHKGFIPWDDDMDVAFIRTEYDRFLTCCEKNLGGEFVLLTPDNDAEYPYNFAKIILKGTRIVQLGYENVSWNKGIYIDIFPLDNIPNNKIERCIHKFCNYLYIKLIERKTSSYIEGKKTIKKVIVFKVLDILARLTSLTYLKKKLIKNCIKYNNKDTDCICNLGGMYGYDRETTNKDYFRRTMSVPFESEQFDIITEYDAYLTKVYGDYMKIPPKEERHIHHFVELDFANLFVGEN